MGTDTRRLPLLLLLVAICARADDTSWDDKLDFGGDLRFRYESIDRDGVGDTNRTRYRVRVALDATITERGNVVLGLATATNNPISRNVTFGNSFSFDDFGIDLAYVEWQVADGLAILGGKMKNPVFRAGKSQIVYDSDLTPEGVALDWKKDRFFAVGALFVIEERSASDDSVLFHGQFGSDIAIGDGNTLTAGAGYFTYSNTVGELPFFFGVPRGNTVDANGRYVYDYANVETFAEFDTRIGGLPATLFAYWTTNTEVDDEDTGWAAGLRLGTMKKAGEWTASWEYRDTEADAVIGAFNESDFAAGGTDSRGHVLTGKYLPRDGISIGAAAYLVESVGLLGAQADTRRYQLDVEFKFD